MNSLVAQTLYVWGYAQTHVLKVSVYKGSQWVLFVPTVVDVYVHNGPLVFTSLDSRWKCHSDSETLDEGGFFEGTISANIPTTKTTIAPVK